LCHLLQAIASPPNYESVHYCCNVLYADKSGITSELIIN
jgi:hypothetical protein